MIIGIVGFQGDVSEHSDILQRLSREEGMEISVRLIRKKEDLEGIDGLIIPGGESTTIYKLLKQYSIYDLIKERIERGLPVMGTCAGVILLSRDTGDERVEGMGALDVRINRNAYGRQINSFIDEVEIKGLGRFKAVFIRAPVIESVENAEVLSEHEGNAIMVRSGNILGMTFHPELTQDIRIHKLFTDIIGGGGYSSTGT
ncbi:glutamine amidotransferase [uncultured archaeon]|nr:glutamine amidotransferase [uncultured archaeon]